MDRTDPLISEMSPKPALAAADMSAHFKWCHAGIGTLVKNLKR